MNGVRKKVEIHHGLKGGKKMIYWNPKRLKELKEKRLKPMPRFPFPPNPKTGCVMFDYYRRMWIVFNGKEWVDVNLKEHNCSLNEKSIQE